MSGRGADVPFTGPLEIRAGKLPKAPVVAPLAALPSYMLMIEHGGAARVTGIVITGLFGVLVLTVLGAHWRRRRLGCLVRIDACGITVRGEPTVGWEEIRAVQVVHRGGDTALVPVPREGVELPMPHLGVLGFRPGPRTAARRTGRWGGVMVLVPRFLSADQDRILAAVSQFGRGVPVVDAWNRGPSLPVPSEPGNL